MGELQVGDIRNVSGCFQLSKSMKTSVQRKTKKCNKNKTLLFVAGLSDFKL